MFRQQALDRLNSPDELDTMVSVVSPAIWLAVVATGLLAAAAFGWSLVGTVKETVRGTAVLAFAQTEQSHAAATTDGFVTAVLVAPGDPVRAGQPLVTLATAALDRRIAEAERQQAVAHRLAAASPDGRVAGEAGTGRLALTLAGLREEKDAAATLRSPVDGRVVAVRAAAGARVEAGEPLVVLAEEAGPMVAEAWFPDDAAHTLKQGMTAILVLPAEGAAGGVIARGHVAAVADRLVPASALGPRVPAGDMPRGGMLRRVTVALDDVPATSARALLPGNEAALTITVGETAPLALVLPSLAPILAR